jgi:uncharacterized protein YdaL
MKKKIKKTKLENLKQRAMIRKNRTDLRHTANEHDISVANENAKDLFDLSNYSWQELQLKLDTITQNADNLKTDEISYLDQLILNFKKDGEKYTDFMASCQQLTTEIEKIKIKALELNN